LQTAADGFHKQGKKREALELLRKMATLDPSNTTSRIKVADLLRQEGMEDEAVAEYEAARAELERQGEQDAASKVLERILEIDDKHVPTLIALTKNLLERGSADRAEPFAKRVLELEQDESSHYELLAEVYRAQQRDEEMADVYRNLAELYRQRGDDAKARDIIQRFAPPEFSAPLEPDTGNIAAGGLEEPPLLEEELLDHGDELGGHEASLEDDELDLDGTELDEDPLLELDEEMPLTPAADSAAAEPVEEIDGDPEQLLAEASVYLRYGKRAQAIRNLEAILARDPEHRGALEKLGEAHADADDSAAAVDAWQRAAVYARESNDLSGYGVLRDRIAALDPSAAEALGGAEAPSLDEDLIDLDAEDEQEAAAAPQEIVEELDLDDDIEIDLDEDPIVEDAPDEGAAEVAPPRSGGGKQKIQDELDEAEFYRQQGLIDEARAIYERVLESAPHHPLALVRMGEIEAEQAEAGGAVAAAAEPPTVEERPALDLDLDVDIDDDIDDDIGLEQPDAVAAQDDEIEFDIPDVDLDEPGVEIASDAAPAAATPRAKQAPLEVSEVELPEVAAGAPELEVDVPDTGTDTPILDGPGAGDPLLEDDDDIVISMEPPVAVDVPDEVVAESLAASSPGESFDDLLLEANADEPRDPAGESFDLAAELAGAFDDDSVAANTTGSMAAMSEHDVFAAVFSEFKKGVDKTLGEGDHEARYDLGIAYREMGLFDDALSEFRAASTSPERRVDCLQMMGLCTIDMGRPEEATVHLQEALATPNLKPEQSLGLGFELGRAYEALEDLDRAREAWQAVATVDPSFCEVEERLASLGQAKPEEEDSDLESFEDLFTDDDDDDTVSAMPESPGESFDDLIAEANLDVSPAAADETGELTIGAMQPPPPPETPDADEAKTVERPVASEPPAEDPEKTAPGGPPAADAEKTVSKPRRRKKKISFV
ncbi:MAG: tetratricopeptide repeat protein, partial [Myxococcota bacterium]